MLRPVPPDFFFTFVVAYQAYIQVVLNTGLEHVEGDRYHINLYIIVYKMPNLFPNSKNVERQILVVHRNALKIKWNKTLQRDNKQTDKINKNIKCKMGFLSLPLCLLKLLLYCSVSQFTYSSNYLYLYNYSSG